MSTPEAQVARVIVGAGLCGCAIVVAIMMVFYSAAAGPLGVLALFLLILGVIILPAKRSRGSHR